MVVCLPTTACMKGVWLSEGLTEAAGRKKVIMPQAPTAELKGCQPGFGGHALGAGP